MITALCAAILAEIEQTRAGSLYRELVVRITKPAFVERKTTAADALPKLISERSEARDAVVEAALPTIR